MPLEPRALTFGPVILGNELYSLRTRRKCKNGRIVLSSTGNDEPTLLDLIPVPERPGDPGFHSFASAISANDSTNVFQWWVNFMHGGDHQLGNAVCIPLILDGMKRRPLWFATRQEFFRAYRGDDVSQAEAVSRLGEFWDKMCECAPPPISNPSAKIFLRTSSESDLLGRYNIVLTGYQCDNISQFINQAMATIRSNFDIVRWAACVLDPKLADCLYEYHINASDRRTIHIDVGSWGARGLGENPKNRTWAVTLEELSACRIRITSRIICREGIDPIKHASSVGAEKCAMISLAGFLLHESVHCCAAETHFHDRTTTTDNSDACSNAHLIQSMFVQYMSFRHGCGEYRLPSQFFSDD